MKITIALTSVSIIFLVIACQAPDKEITPSQTSNTGQTSTPGTVVATKPNSQEIYDTFVRLALKNSSGTQSMTIRKWLPSKTQIKVYWDGGSTSSLLGSLDKVMSDMNGLNKNSKMLRTTIVTEADIIINRVDIATHNAKYASYQVTNTTVQGNTFTLWGSTAITKAVVWLSPTTPTALQNGVLRHELTHALGIGHTENTKSIMVPVMSSANYDFSTFSVLDQRVLQILGDSRVKHGMNEAQASSIIKEYAAK